MDRKFTFVTVLALALVGGCYNGYGTLGTSFSMKRKATIAGQSLDRARFMVFVMRETSPGRQVQKLPAAFDSVVVDLDNAASDMSNPSAQTLAVSPSGISNGILPVKDPNNSSLALFRSLIPGPGYSLNVTLKNSNSTVGTGKRTGISLPAGATQTVTVIISDSGVIAVTNPRSTTASTQDGNGDWTVYKFDEIDLVTGFNSSEGSEVSKMEVLIQGDCYTGASSSQVKIAEQSSGYNVFTWDTFVTTSLYDRDKLIIDKTGIITFRLIDSSGNTLGESKINIKVLDGAAGIDLQLR